MERTRVEFKMTMPGIGSWDGKWSGSSKNYLIVRSLSDEEIKALGVPCSWSHHWSDRWSANVSARIMKKGERSKKTDGFCGYDWMVDNIVRYGATVKPGQVAT